jgi:hypothetical protein
MPIQVKCGCGRTMNAPDSYAGRSGRCSGCGAVVAVPGPVADATEPEPESRSAPVEVACDPGPAIIPTPAAPAAPVAKKAAQPSPSRWGGMRVLSTITFVGSTLGLLFSALGIAGGIGTGNIPVFERALSTAAWCFGSLVLSFAMDMAVDIVEMLREIRDKTLSG